jgi:hypothetical protein
LLSAIQKGASLRKVETPAAPAAPVMDARSSLLTAIQKGATLRKVEPVEKPKTAAANTNASASIMDILARRAASQAESDSESDNEWDD